MKRAVEDEATIVINGAVAVPRPWPLSGAAVYVRTSACDLAENRRLCRQMKGTSDDN